MTKGKAEANQHKPIYSSGNSKMLNDFPLSAPSNEMELADDDDHEMAPCPSSVQWNATIQKECTSKALFSATELSKPARVASAPAQSSSSLGGVMNFPYFSRFASLSGANARKATAAGSESNNEEPTFVKCCHQESDSRDPKLSVPPSVKGIDSPNPEQVPLVPQKSHLLTLKDHHEKIPDLAMATSSVCSANILERASNGLLTCDLKRKCYETEDSEGQSDDTEEETIGTRKTASYHTGSKRTRAAAMDNLSEWNQRDRINEKMRELQELIPNCNKTDKASLLDEAIEYTKKLQLQLQIYSMGTGMCMSPMVLPTMMQQARRPYVPQLAPMGIRAGFGMGIHDAIYNMTPMHNVEISVSGHPMSNPMFPGQELLMPMPCVPLPIFGSPPLPVPVGNVTAMPHDVVHKSVS